MKRANDTTFRTCRYATLFPRCAAVVFHGGAGTFAAAMHAALPVVIIPLLEWFDQPGWGGCAHALGVGTIVRRDPNAEVSLFYPLHFNLRILLTI